MCAHPITMIWRSTNCTNLNFHQIHHVIKDDGSFQSLFDFPDLNLNSAMASCDLINMSPFYLFFDKGVLARTLQAYRVQILHVQGRNFNYRLITLFILKPWSGFKSRCLHILKHQYLEHEIFCLAKLKSIFKVLWWDSSSGKT